MAVREKALVTENRDKDKENDQGAANHPPLVRLSSRDDVKVVVLLCFVCTYLFSWQLTRVFPTSSNV